MKHTFIRVLRTAAAVETATAPAAAETKTALTSPELTALNAKYDAQWAVIVGITDPRSKEAQSAKLALWAIDGEIKAEESRLVKLQNDAKIAELRNQRLALNATQLDAYAALITAKADKKTTPEKLAELQTTFDTAREAVDNELLAKYASSKSAAKKADGTVDANTPTSGDSAKIVELFISGSTLKQIEDMGYKRSTVWHAVDKYKKANNLK